MNFGGQEMIVIFLVVLLLFGGNKIPELMRGIGKGVGELQKHLDESKRTLQASLDEADDHKVHEIKPRLADNTHPHDEHIDEAS
jgi:sec-independent protein translocase protein TatA